MSTLVCNATGCKALLVDKGYASTECLHCFCKLHAQEYLNRSNTCPVCNCSSKLFTVLFSDTFEDSVLVGQSPNNIIEAVDMATRFLLTQSETTSQKAVAQLKLFSTQAQQMQSSFKARLAQSDAQNQQLRAEVTRRQAESQQLRKELIDVKEQYMKLRDHVKRTSAQRR
jgi:t-SNARE complex subunit (syntaxin)